MELQQILTNLETDHYLFEEGGKKRQPVLRFASIHEYDGCNPGVRFEYYLHQELNNDDSRYFLVQRDVVLLRGSETLLYMPIDAIEVIDNRAYRMEYVSYCVLFLKIFFSRGTAKGDIAILRVMPKQDPKDILSRDGETCRFPVECLSTDTPSRAWNGNFEFSLVREQFR